MADIYELSIALNLRGGLSDEEVAELRWHLGLGPKPESLHIVPAFPAVVEAENGELVVVDEPVPLLAEQGVAWKVGGVLVSALLSPLDTRCGTWALTVRQEVHPDGFASTGELLTWLASKADDRHRTATGDIRVGWTRFCDSERFEPLAVRNGEVIWP
ncbi:hypothetical protein [Streptomyces monashensis]|uniref:Uncharacterized protein n=1 Tax=Streptomyces monashensis TaxID=1678012 RepID=A0A1S2PC21_9ACTN|nr:hypothetical protein [Streptomyces monashensis]OIJ91301.1 hypothetical protein BIV23_39815 [Streptomyces monashensis]